MRKPYPPQIPDLLVEEIVRAALREDLGRSGDITSASTVPPDARASLAVNLRAPGCVCGVSFARAAFALMDPSASITTVLGESVRSRGGETVLRVSGNARAILSAERTALNFLMHLSGVATETARYVDAIEGTGAKICCTRKTLPGLRAAQKYAVRCGGGSNHRYGLDDAVLIKDNHIAVAGGVSLAIERARSNVGHLVRIEVEVDTLTQFEEAMTAGSDVILLDNMSVETLEKAVSLRTGLGERGLVLEASGGIDLDTVRSVAETGVDYISTSRITMAAQALDFGLDIAFD